MDNDVPFAVFYGPGDLRPNILAATIIPWALALIAIGLRFWSKRLSKARLGWDDWLILASGVVSQVQFGIGWWWYSIGGGTFIGPVSINRLRTPLMIAYITEETWIVTIFLVRASALALWLRLFSIKRWIKWFCWIWQVLNSMWVVAMIIVTLTECRPLWAFFDPLQARRGACEDIYRQFFGIGISSIILDVAVLVVPLKVCWELQMSYKVRLVVCGMFATSFLAIAVTIVRMVITVRSDSNLLEGLNATWVFADVGAWIVAEMNIGIVSACLPCLRPAMLKVIPSSWISRSAHRPSDDRRYQSRTIRGATMYGSDRAGLVSSDLAQGFGARKTESHSSKSAMYVAGSDAAALSSRIPMAHVNPCIKEYRAGEQSSNRILVKDNFMLQYE